MGAGRIGQNAFWQPVGVGVGDAEADRGVARSDGPCRPNGRRQLERLDPRVEDRLQVVDQ